MTEKPDATHVGGSGAAASDPAASENFVPMWLAIVVLILLLGVMAVAGYVIRGLVAGDTRTHGLEEAEINRWKTEVKKEPTNLAARLQLGYAYQQADRLDRALEQYEYVLDRDSKDTGALYNTGIIYLSLKLDDKGEEALWNVLDVTPDHTLAAKALGDLYAKQKHYRSLLKAVKPAVEAHPEVADLQYLTGLAYEHTGHPDWATARYRLALKVQPDMPEASEGLRRLGATP